MPDRPGQPGLDLEPGGGCPAFPDGGPCKAVRTGSQARGASFISIALTQSALPRPQSGTGQRDIGRRDSMRIPPRAFPTAPGRTLAPFNSVSWRAT
jgi:hypothetical protein